MKRFWISDSIFDWFITPSSHRLGSNKSVNRAYELWSRASELLSVGSSSDCERADAISNLKRALNHRLERLQTSYKLRDLPIGSSKGVLERLEKLDVVRPVMLRSLLQVR